MVRSTVPSWDVVGQPYFSLDLNSRDAQGPGEVDTGRRRTVEALQVIAAPRRLRILELVWDRELSAGDIAAQFDVSWSAVSQHLSVLKAAGFLVERREGTSRIYRADQDAMGPLRAVVEEHWRAGLTRMKELAEAEQRANRDEGAP
jgi:DNA-binding transcriptional ArsR family regulator